MAGKTYLPDDAHLQAQEILTGFQVLQMLCAKIHAEHGVRVTINAPDGPLMFPTVLGSSCSLYMRYVEEIR